MLNNWCDYHIKEIKNKKDHLGKDRTDNVAKQLTQLKHISEA